MRLAKAAEIDENGSDETLSYYGRRRAPAAIAASKWSTKRYMQMNRLVKAIA